MDRDFVQLKRGYIHRPRMDSLLTKGLDYPLVSVVAGPGYGKTMAVAGFVKSVSMRLVWMRMQETDHDIYRFWTHFTDAVRRELPELSQQLQKTSIPAVLGVYDVISQMFGRELENGPILIVLDNFESAPSAPVMELLRVLTRAEQPGLHIIVMTNEKLPIGSITSGGGQFRVTMDDLSFTTEETATFFQEYGLSFSSDELKNIADSTGGWPLALHLICVNQTDGKTDVLREKTHQQLAAELFEQYYFSAYSKEMRLLMIKLSCFERFPLELVIMLSESDSGAIVDELSRNVFISYDYSLELFQFQTMYRTFLKHRQALLSESEKAEMYDFMGGWYLEQGYCYEALDCFWYIQDYDRYLTTVFMLPKVRRGINITSEILRNLEKFPGEYSLSNPSFDFCKAVLLLNGMQVEKAQALLIELAERLSGMEDRSEDIDLLLGDTYVVLADIRLFLNRDDGLCYIKKAAEHLPHGCRIRTRDLMLVGNNCIFFLPNNEAGQLEHMKAYFFEYARYADTVSNGSGYGYEWLFAAQAEFLTEQFDRAREDCFQAITRATTTGQHDIICNAYWDMMRIELYCGDYWQAKHWLDELITYVDSRKIADLYELKDCAASWFYLRMGDFDRVAPWVSETAPIRSEYMLDVGRNRIIIIYYLSVLGRHNEAFAEITRLESILRENGKWHEKILLYVHKSLRLLERGDKTQALIAFKKAYDIVYANNIFAIFAEFGSEMQKIVRAARARNDIGFDLEWLDIVYKKAGSFDKRAAAVKKAYRSSIITQNTDDFNLNAKEKEILLHISQGMTRSEISAHMNTSLSNVKRYINNIYTKLGAINRADAIHIATINGLIDNPHDQ